jgi:iron complex transport system ATP-binding protein
MPGLSVEEAVISGFFASYVVPAHRDVTDAMRQRARQALELARALPLLGRSYAELSAGETRRVLIARALVNQPRALLLDEPSTGLDLISRQHLVDTMQHLAREGITLVLVTHHIEEVIPEIGRVVLMKGGRILADGPRAELLCSGPLSELFGGPVQVREDEGRLTAWVG